MEILKILTESADQLYTEDLDFFEVELATGNYDAVYIEQCKLKIAEIRRWINGEPTPATPADPSHANSVQLQLPPASPTSANLSPKEHCEQALAAMRIADNYKELFKAYIEQNEDLDAAFVDENFGLFAQWELETILSVRQMGEPFLEKYFGALSHKKIAQYQQFSEAFFIKHYRQLDAALVLTKGKNEWRKKENRSNQLDVFLRLKGVKL